MTLPANFSPHPASHNLVAVRRWLESVVLAPTPSVTLQAIYDNGQLARYVPSLAALVGVQQNAYHDMDVWGHTLRVVDGVAPELSHRLAALFHDVGKPQTYRVVDDQVHFMCHEHVGTRIVDQDFRRLGYPAQLREAVVAGVQYHMRLKQSGQHGELIALRTLRKFKIAVGAHLELVLDVMDADNRAHAPLHQQPHQIPGIRARLLTMDQHPIPTNTRGIVSGKDLMQHFNVAPGPHIGQALQAIRAAEEDTGGTTVAQAYAIAAVYLT